MERSWILSVNTELLNQPYNHLYMDLDNTHTYCLNSCCFKSGLWISIGITLEIS